MRISDFAAYKEIRQKFFDHCKTCKECGKAIEIEDMTFLCSEGDKFLEQATRLVQFCELTFGLRH